MIGTFLHSPMLDELKSLETILMEKVCDLTQKLQKVYAVVMPDIAVQLCLQPSRLKQEIQLKMQALNIP